MIITKDSTIGFNRNSLFASGHMIIINWKLQKNYLEITLINFQLHSLLINLKIHFMALNMKKKNGISAFSLNYLLSIYIYIYTLTHTNIFDIISFCFILFPFEIPFLCLFSLI